MYKETSQYPPVGSIMAWMQDFAGTPNLPDDWVELNGQELSDDDSPYNGYILPDLNGVLDSVQKFLRGSTTSGGTGGAETHSHSNLNFNAETRAKSGSYMYYIEGTRGLLIAEVNHLPLYYEVVWILRVK